MLKFMNRLNYFSCELVESDNEFVVGQLMISSVYTFSQTADQAYSRDCHYQGWVTLSEEPNLLL